MAIKKSDAIRKEINSKRLKLEPKVSKETKKAIDTVTTRYASAWRELAKH